MHVLFISQYFTPEVGATQTRIHEFARAGVAAGHRVTVLTEFPNHPHGRIPPEYRGKIFTREVGVSPGAFRAARDRPSARIVRPRRPADPADPVGRA